MILKIKRSVLCQEIFKSKKKVNSDSLCEFIIKHLKIKITNAQKNDLKQQIKNKFLVVFNRYWKKSYRSVSKFETKNNSWLQKNEIFNLESKNLPSTQKLVKPGRPKKKYSALTDRTKRRRKKQLQEKYSQEEISDAIKSNQSDVKNVVIVRNNALALYMDTNLSRRKYEMIRKYNQKNRCSNRIYPSYNDILTAKKDCYPLNICISESCVSLKIQDLVDHTIFRLILSLSDDEITKFHNKDLIIKFKWRMDGSSNQQNFKQNFQDEEISDNSVFAVMLVPLEISGSNEGSNESVWINQRPNSPRYCRPISFEFVKESSEKTIQIYELYNYKIDNLQPTVIENVRGISCKVRHHFQCTMVDGKAANAITGQRSSASCNVCKASPSQMNNLNLVKSLPCLQKSLELGFHPLHSRINFMNCILHLGYNMDFKKGCARGNDKVLQAATKKKIQNEIKTKLGLPVHVVKQGK